MKSLNPNSYIKIDTNLIKSIYPELQNLSIDQVRQIFILKLMNQGVLSHKNALRELFVETIRDFDEILEIGPFAKPVLLGEGVKYFDVLDRQGLIDRAKKHNLSPQNVPEINFVSASGDLSVVNEKFDAVFSSHCIEHQIDLVDHISKVGNILRNNGAYFLIIPDHRYCFDHFLNPSNVGEILGANKRGKKEQHGLEKVIEHRALTTHNDALRHWLDDHGSNKRDNKGLFTEKVLDNILSAANEYNNCEKYIDVHAWQFTPETFGVNMTLLIKLNYIPFKKVHVHMTPFGRQEFTAVLYK